MEERKIETARGWVRSIKFPTLSTSQSELGESLQRVNAKMQQLGKLPQDNPYASRLEKYTRVHKQITDRKAVYDKQIASMQKLLSGEFDADQINEKIRSLTKEISRLKDKADRINKKMEKLAELNNAVQLEKYAETKEKFNQITDLLAKQENEFNEQAKEIASKIADKYPTPELDSLAGKTRILLASMSRHRDAVGEESEKISQQIFELEEQKTSNSQLPFAGKAAEISALEQQLKRMGDACGKDYYEGTKRDLSRANRLTTLLNQQDACEKRMANMEENADQIFTMFNRLESAPPPVTAKFPQYDKAILMDYRELAEKKSQLDKAMQGFLSALPDKLDDPAKVAEIKNDIQGLDDLRDELEERIAAFDDLWVPSGKKAAEALQEIEDAAEQVMKDVSEKKGKLEAQIYSNEAQISNIAKQLSSKLDVIENNLSEELASNQIWRSVHEFIQEWIFSNKWSENFVKSQKELDDQKTCVAALKQKLDTKDIVGAVRFAKNNNQLINAESSAHKDKKNRNAVAPLVSELQRLDAAQKQLQTQVDTVNVELHQLQMQQEKLRITSAPLMRLRDSVLPESSFVEEASALSQFTDSFLSWWNAPRGQNTEKTSPHSSPADIAKHMPHPELQKDDPFAVYASGDSWDITTKTISLINHQYLSSDKRDKDHNTFLHLALVKPEGFDNTMLRHLKKRTSNGKPSWKEMLNMTNNAGETPLLLVVRHESEAGDEKFNLVQQFLADGANIDAQVFQAVVDDNGYNNYKIMALLIAKDATVLSKHADFTQNVEFWMNVNLDQQGRMINVQDKNGNTLLHIAIKNGDIEQVNYLLDRGADTSLKNNQGQSSLELAQALSGKQTVVAQAGRVLGLSNYISEICEAVEQKASKVAESPTSRP